MQGRPKKRHGLSCIRTAAVAAALVQLEMAAGCGPGARVGPFRGFVSSVEDLALSIDERIRPIETLYDPDATLGYSGPIKSIIRAASARAQLFLAGRRLFRAEVSHSLAAELARLVLNEDGFLLVYWPDKKAFEGEIRTLLRRGDEAKSPDVGLGPDHFVIRKLFFPDLEPVSGEVPVLVYGKDTYTVEFWTRGRLTPVRSVTVDDWSHAPTRAVFYTQDGRTAADIRWSEFEHLKGRYGTCEEELDCVVAKEVIVRLPLAGRKVRFTLNDPRYNVKIRHKAFRLRVPPGVEVEEIGPQEPEEPEGEAPPEKPSEPVSGSSATTVARPVQQQAHSANAASHVVARAVPASRRPQVAPSGCADRRPSTRE